jgi:tagaturonate reductase
MNQLFREHLRRLRNNPDVTVPDDSIFQLPEKIIQFGTGAFLRGLADYYVDKANRQGIFNGRIVVVKSTDQGDLKAFERQDNLYTLTMRGVQNVVAGARLCAQSSYKNCFFQYDRTGNPAGSG